MERTRQMKKRVEQMPDGRLLIYYSFSSDETKTAGSQVRTESDDIQDGAAQSQKQARREDQSR